MTIGAPAKQRARVHPPATRPSPPAAMDASPNRFLSGEDWADPRYTALREEFARIYRDELCGEPHPFGATSPESIVTHWSREWEYPWAALNSGVRAGMHVVDLGAGGSPLLPFFSRIGCVCTAVDINFRSATGRNNLRGFVVEPEALFPNIRWLVESMDRTSLPSGSMDRAFCISVLEHVGADMAMSTLQEIHRILRPGGWALITTDVDGAHRTQTLDFGDIIAMGFRAGLPLRGVMDVTRPPHKPGTYDVVGFILEKRGP